jgi:hypothetical protein
MIWGDEIVASGETSFFIKRLGVRRQPEEGFARPEGLRRDQIPIQGGGAIAVQSEIQLRG